jgi:Calcineurin-like phosphoesterase
MKTLVVGDIQGCYQEFLELLSLAGITTEDSVVAVGDLVNRGPDSRSVVEFFRNTSHAKSVLGNHERKHIRWFHRKTTPAVSMKIARAQFSEQGYVQAIEFMESLPVFIDLPEAIVVHAFWEPGVTLQNQKEHVLVGGTNSEKYIQDICKNRPWWELYDGPKPLIVGHHDYSKQGIPLNHENRVYGIDTGCCYGRALTGLILPDFRFISVPAKRDYWGEIRQKYNQPIS